MSCSGFRRGSPLDAILGESGKPAGWPRCDVIVGNPPYLDARLLKRKLGADQTETIRALYNDRLPGFTDLVCYWFENGRALIEAGAVSRVGFVAINSIRKNTNLPVMHRIAATTRIFEAWSEEKWTDDGAAVAGKSEQRVPWYSKKRTIRCARGGCPSLDGGAHQPQWMP